AVGQHAYRAYRALLASDRWQRLESLGARPQRLLFASTSSKDKRATDTLYAFADHGVVDGVLSADGGDCDAVLAAYVKAGVNVDALAQQLQSDGAKAFVASWQDLLKSIGAKSKALA